jgi:hypothetical protein
MLTPRARKVAERLKMRKMAVRSSRGELPQHPQHPQPHPISRVVETAPTLTVDQATEADFEYFCDHPDEEQYIPQFVPGEFGKKELAPIPPGFRYATIVSATLRVDGQPVGRLRELMATCEDVNVLGLDARENEEEQTVPLLPDSQKRGAHTRSSHDQLTLNQRVPGSSPGAPTK